MRIKLLILIAIACVASAGAEARSNYRAFATKTSRLSLGTNPEKPATVCRHTGRALQIARDSDIVAFNVSNNKFHALSCTWAERCTVHCIQITRKEAHKRGGIPCKVCGGGE